MCKSEGLNSLTYTHYAGNITSTNVRLVTSTGEIAYADGRVQVLYNNTWKAICDNQWGMLDAQVVCRMLCFQYVNLFLIISVQTVNGDIAHRKQQQEVKVI